MNVDIGIAASTFIGLVAIVGLGFYLGRITAPVKDMGQPPHQALGSDFNPRWDDGPPRRELNIPKQSTPARDAKGRFLSRKI